MRLSSQSTEGKQFASLRPRQIAIGFLCVGTLIRIASVGSVGARTLDERVYTQQANIWLQEGRPGIRALVQRYERDPVTRYYPMPTRAGTIRLFAAAMTLSGRTDVLVGAVVSCIASIFSLFLLAWIGVRFFSAWVTSTAVLFFAVFPPELVIARRAWSDAPVELASLLLVWLVCEIVRDSSRRSWHFLFAVVASLGVTLKESFAVPLGICGVWLLCVLLKRGEWRNALMLTLMSLAGCLVAITWLAEMAGGFRDLERVVTGIAGVNAVNPYAIKWASGPGYLLLDGLWIVSPMFALLALTGVLRALDHRSSVGVQYAALPWIAAFTLSNVVVAMIVPHWLNLRYVSVAFGTYCLLAGVGAELLFSIGSKQFADRRRGIFAILFAAVMLTGAATASRYFFGAFVQGGTPDLAIRMLEAQLDR